MIRHRVKIPLLVALVGGAVFSVGWAVRQNLAAAEAQAGAGVFRVTRAQAETRLAQLEAQPVAVPEAALAAPAGTARSGMAATPPGARARRTGPDEPADPWSLVMGDPVLQNLYLAAERASLAGRYAAVLAELRLSPAQAGKLEELILRRNEQRMDLDDIVRTNRPGDQDQAIARLWDRADQAFRAEAIGLLGQPAYEGFERYERALAVWELVNRFAGAVALEGEPLTGAQASRLTETLAQSSPPYRAGGRADPNAIDWPGVLDASTAILTEPQHASFLNMAPLYPIPVDRREAPAPPARD